MLNISQVILVRTDSNLCMKELTVHWSAPNSLIRSYLQPCTNSMCGGWKWSYGSHYLIITDCGCPKGGSFLSKSSHNSPEICYRAPTLDILTVYVMYLISLSHIHMLRVPCLHIYPRHLTTTNSKSGNQPLGSVKGTIYVIIYDHIRLEFITTLYSFPVVLKQRQKSQCLTPQKCIYEHLLSNTYKIISR